MNVCVVGCGRWGKNHVRVFAELGVLHSVADKDLDRVQTVLTQQCPSAKASTFEDAMSEPEIEIAVIATPAVTHYDLTRRALLAGKHVLVEKPISMTITDAQNLVKLAAEQNRLLMVGHILRYHSAFTRLEEMCRDGAIGNLHYIYSNRLNLGQLRTEENILWSFAPHDISMILSLAGSLPTSVHASGHVRITDSIPDSTLSTMAFENGMNAHIFVSWLHPFKEQRLIVVGDTGMIVFDDTQPNEMKLGLFRHTVNRTSVPPQLVKADLEYVPTEPCEPLSAQAEHFLFCIETGRQPLTDGTEGINVLRVLDAAQRSLQSKSQEALFPHS